VDLAFALEDKQEDSQSLQYARDQDARVKSSRRRGEGRPRRRVVAAAGQILLYCTACCEVSPDQRSDPGASSLSLPHHHERAAARDLDQQRQVKMTSVSLGLVLFAGARCRLRQRQGFSQGKMVQADGYPQIIRSFTACGGGVSVVSLVGSVGVCEAASQCGYGKGSVLPLGLACLSKARKSVVCVRDVVKPTGKLVSIAQQQCGADTWGDIV